MKTLKASYNSEMELVDSKRRPLDVTFVDCNEDAREVLEKVDALLKAHGLEVVIYGEDDPISDGWMFNIQPRKAGSAGGLEGRTFDRKGNPISVFIPSKGK